MDLKRIVSFTAAACMLLASASCGEKINEQNHEVRVYTSFFATTGNPIAEDNDIQQIIAEKIGAKCEETWLNEKEDLNSKFTDLMVSNKYPDLIYPDSANMNKLIDAGALIPLDNYWDDYPYLKNFFDEKTWDRIRNKDGHIYYIPLFSNVYLQDTNPNHTDEAFWIQLKVLEWAGYPKLYTLDDYFGLIEGYMEAHPEDEAGDPYIGFELLATDTMFFSLDNPPMFLDGYPNDGCCIVDPKTLTAKDYNLSPTAEKWFRKLNDEYSKGVIDPGCFMQNSEQYYAKIKTGRVLGLVDQKWNFDSASRGLPVECTYIPFGIVAEKGIEEHYHSRQAFNGSSGVGASISCTDPEGAVKFLNDILSPEIMNLRFWGVEGVDYSVDENGVFYRSDEQKELLSTPDYAYNHNCVYGYLPYAFGMAQDGINAYCPAYQPYEYYKSLDPEIQKCFDAYDANTYVELLNPAPENEPWYPMWTFSNAMDDSTPGGRVMAQIDALKHKYLPQVVMSDDFESEWAQYKEEYGKIDSQVYFDELTEEVRRRSGL